MASFYADINAIDDTSVGKPESKDINGAILKSEKETDYEQTSGAKVTVCEKLQDFQNSDSDSDEFDLNEEFLKTIEDLEDITGIRCQAPFETEWTGRQYHNAMIMSVIDNTEEINESNQSLFVKVLFLNPTLLEMKPCPFYLDGKCRFGLFIFIVLFIYTRNL